MKINHRHNISILIVVLLFSACQKDEPRVSFGLQVADRYNGGESKVYMDGYKPKFIENEAVKINGETYLIDIRGGSPAVYDVAPAGEYYAVYPASWVNGNASSTPSITFPDMQKYIYDETLGEQIIENPMVAYANSNGGTLEFHNVASLAKVQIKNDYGSPLKIKYVALYTDDTPLSGPGTIKYFNTDTAKISLSSGITNVSIDCSDLPTLLNGATKEVTFALPPIKNVVLYVDVYMTSADEEETTKYSFTKETAQGKTIGRNEMGVIKVTLSNTGTDAVKTCGLFWGSGASEADPFIIMNKADLIRFKDCINNDETYDNGTKHYNAAGTYYLQTANIDLSDEYLWPGIGTSAHPFLANYDGSNTSITLNITNVTEPTGIFGYVGGENDSFIINLNAKGQITNDAVKSVGGIIGTVVGAGKLTVKNCSNATKLYGVHNSTTNETQHILGGIVGSVTAGSIVIKSCRNTGGVSKYYGYAGGIVGYISNGISSACEIDSCLNTAKIESKTKGYIGGICGYINASVSTYQTIKNCINTGMIVGNTSTACQYVGGIVGCGKVNLTKCTNSGDVNGYKQVGGIIGYCVGEKMKNCKNTGNISSNYTMMGGLIGQAYTHDIILDGCLNTGTIKSNITTTNSSTAEAAGLIGYSNVGLTIVNCGNTGNITSTYDLGGLSNRTVKNVTIVNSFCKADISCSEKRVAGLALDYGTGNSTNIDYFRNCYYYGTLTGNDSYKGTLYSYFGNKAIVNQYYCYDVVGDGQWGVTGSTVNKSNATCRFTVGTPVAGKYPITCATSHDDNEYWKITEEKTPTLLEALEDWRSSPLQEVTLPTGTTYLEWEAGDDGFPTLKFDHIKLSDLIF